MEEEGSTRTNRIQTVVLLALEIQQILGTLGTGRDYPMGASNSTRGLIAGGYPHPGSSSTNSVEYVTMASTGAGQEFGDLTGARTGGGEHLILLDQFSMVMLKSVTNIIDFLTITTLEMHRVSES